MLFTISSEMNIANFNEEIFWNADLYENDLQVSHRVQCCLPLRLDSMVNLQFTSKMYFIFISQFCRKFYFSYLPKKTHKVLLYIMLCILSFYNNFTMKFMICIFQVTFSFHFVSFHFFFSVILSKI